MGLSFKHAGDAGDVVFSLPTIRALGGGTLYLNKLPGLVREVMTQAKRDFIAPLLESQPYISSVQMYSGNAVCYDLNYWREYYFKHPEKGLSLASFCCRAFDVDESVLNEPWLVCDKKEIEPVVIARSPRYHLAEFPWKRVVQKYKSQSVFVGLQAEHAEFCSAFGYVPFYNVANALDLAMVINGAKLAILNQSFPGAIAEGLKKPKILECCPSHPDCCFERADAQNIFTRNVFLPDIGWKSSPIYLDLPNSEIEVPLRKNRIIHCVERHEQKNADAERRVAYALESWKTLYRTGEVVPCHVSNFQRTARNIGDKRDLPYLKDVLAAGLAMSKNDDDIIMLTNDDTVIHPDIAMELFNMRTPAICSGRSHFENGGIPNLTSTAIKPNCQWGGDIGRDLFAFKKSFLVKSYDEIPDFLLGESEWDLVNAAWIKKTLFGELTTVNSREKRDPRFELPAGYVWHEDHAKAWKIARPDSPAKLHNRRLMIQFYEANGMDNLI